MKIFVSCIAILFLLGSCKTEKLYISREYQSKGYKFSFNADGSYDYKHAIGEGHVIEFSRGAWKQDGNKLFLLNKVSNSNELPISVRPSPSNESDLQLVINILPKKIYFLYLPGVRDLFNVELVADNVPYPITNEANIIRLRKTIDSAYFRAYPKSGVEIDYEILTDTLRSQLIGFNGLENTILTIDVDCNPLYFAQVKMPDDTLKIINRRNVRWRKFKLHRYN